MNALSQFLKDIPQTFYAASFYKNLIGARKGIGFGFLLFITLINLGHLYIFVAPTMRNVVAAVQPVLATFPEVTLKNGTLSFSGTSPQTYSITAPEEAEPYRIVFDTQLDMNQIAPLEKKMAEEHIILIVGKQSFALYDFSRKLAQVESYREMKDAAVTQDEWQAFGKALENMIVPVSLLSFGGMFLFLHLVTAFLGALLLMIFDSVFKVRLTLDAAMRLACAAKVPVAIAFSVITPSLPLQAALWFGFAAFGLISMREPKAASGV